MPKLGFPVFQANVLIRLCSEKFTNKNFFAYQTLVLIYVCKFLTVQKVRRKYLQPEPSYLLTLLITNLPDTYGLVIFVTVLINHACCPNHTTIPIAKQYLNTHFAK